MTQTGYQQDYQQISMQISDSRSFADWAEVYKRLVRWELELSSTESNMTDMLKMQKEEANIGFAKYIQQNYLDWVAPSAACPHRPVPTAWPQGGEAGCVAPHDEVPTSSSSLSFQALTVARRSS